MSRSSRRIPSLKALRAFWASARHGSFAAAAQALRVTPSAVSLQIRQLEDELGVRLFERTPQGLVLTPDGAVLIPGVDAAFEQLHSSVAAFHSRHRARQPLVLSAPVSLAGRWLVPRLARFLEAHPGIEVHVSTPDETGTPPGDGTALAIHRCVDVTGPTTTFLMEERVAPVCSPALLQRLSSADPVSWLIDAPLLHDDSRINERGPVTWSAWLLAARIRRSDGAGGLRFSSAALALDAAVSGLGIALAPTVLVEDDIAGGRLVRLAADELPSGAVYVVTHTPELADDEGVAHLKSWLIALCGGQTGTSST